jgi:predicted type IV restriction endonuclease
MNTEKEIDKQRDSNNAEKERLLKELDDRNKEEDKFIADELERMRKENVQRICEKKDEFENAKANFLKKLADC